MKKLISFAALSTAFLLTCHAANASYVRDNPLAFNASKGIKKSPPPTNQLRYKETAVLDYSSNKEFFKKYFPNFYGYHSGAHHPNFELTMNTLNKPTLSFDKEDPRRVIIRYVSIRAVKGRGRKEVPYVTDFEKAVKARALPKAPRSEDSKEGL